MSGQPDPSSPPKGQCPRCGCPNRKTAKFCSGCGVGLGVEPDRGGGPPAAGTETVYLDDLDGFGFEQLCKRIFEKSGMGDRVERIGGVADGGRDLVIHRQGGSVVVECKHQPSSSVGRPVVQKLHSAVVSSGAAGGMVVTTGRYSAEAVEHARLLSEETPIDLLDLNRLTDLAQRSGIRLVTGRGNALVLCFPASDMAELHTMFSRLLAPVQSHPSSAAELLEMTPAGLRLEACYTVTVDIDQDFSTSVGQIHSVHEHGVSGMFSARNGAMMDPAQASFLHGGSQMIRPSQIPQIACPVHREDFVVDTTSLRRIVAERMIQAYSTTVSYTGKNNVSYDRLCKIGPRSVQITDIGQVLLPVYSVNIKFLKKLSKCSLVQNGRDVRITSSDLYECGVCGRDAGRTVLLCNSCGTMAHTPKFFGSHSHICRDCQRTVCLDCTFWVRSLLFFKRTLCERCADLRKGVKRRLAG